MDGWVSVKYILRIADHSQRERERERERLGKERDNLVVRERQRERDEIRLIYRKRELKKEL